MSEQEQIALLAGEGVLPRLVINGIHAKGKKVLLIAIKNVTDSALEEIVEDVVWLHITQLGKAVDTCLKYGVAGLVMIGRVKHDNIFSISLFSMDWTTLKTWLGLDDKRADTILGAISDAFINKGIEVFSSVRFLQQQIAKEGVLTKQKPSKREKNDIDLGVKVARCIGEMDVGQTVVVKNGSVVSVEAMEGTDYCIQRAGEIAGKGCIVVKMAKPNQDMRFDVPVIGMNTIEKLVSIGASGMVLEAERTIFADLDIIEYANNNGLFVVAI